nr:MAG TPA: hypothetical protein [Caudoviricetes sp.]
MEQVCILTRLVKNLVKCSYYTISAGKQAAAKQTFVFT